MAACPNKNSEEWKELVESLGSEAEALYVFIQNNYEIPSDYSSVIEKDSYVFDMNDDELLDLEEVIKTKAKISHSLAANYNIFKNSEHDKYTEDLKKLIDDFRKADINQSVEVFINNSISKMRSLNKKIDQESDDIGMLHTISNFAGTFQLISELTPIINNPRYKFSEQIKGAASALSSDIEIFNSKYLKYSEKTIARRLGAESTKMRYKIKGELEIEFKENNPLKSSTLSKEKYKEAMNTFVNKALSERSEEIKQLEIEHVRRQLRTAPRDPGVLTTWLVDPRGINDQIIQLTVKLLDEADDKAEEAFREDKEKVVTVWDRFIKGESLNTDSLKESVQTTIDKLKSNKDKIQLTEDGKNYIDSDTGKKYKRVTNFIGSEIEDTINEGESVPDYIKRLEGLGYSKKSAQNKALLPSASSIGTALDELVRDYFSDTVEFDESKYDVISSSVKSNFISQLAELKKKFKESGETVVSEDILLFSDVYDVAGTVDILTYDKDGNFRIYDMKTMRKDS